MRNATTFEFQVRRDRLVRDAELDLSFAFIAAADPVTPAVYLNDAMMGVVPISNEQLGAWCRPLPLDARLIADFNQVRLEFVGHYTDICEEPTHSSLWVNLSSNSTLRLGASRWRCRTTWPTSRCRSSIRVIQHGWNCQWCSPLRRAWHSSGRRR